MKMQLHGVPMQAPSHLVLLRYALDYWVYNRWDEHGFDWYAIRKRPHALRTALVDGTLKAVLLTEAGAVFSVPASQWSNTRLWGEAYESGLLTIFLDQQRIDGFLYVDRKQVEVIRDGACPTAAPRSEETKPKAADLPSGARSEELIKTIETDSPALALILKALFDDIEIDRVVLVDDWLREAWPDAMHELWPDRRDRNKSAPSLAKDINFVVRTIPQVQLAWRGDPSSDPMVSELAVRYPLVAAALEVARLCRRGDLDSFGHRVTVSTSSKELAKRVPIHVGSPPARNLLRRLAKICIPDEKVTGGGRRLRRA